MAERKELNMDEKIEIVNIAPWNVAFTSTDGHSGVSFAPSGKQRVRRDEVVQQVERGNKLFVGTDGAGSHATLYINDADTRKYLEFDTDDGEQNVLTPEKVQKLFSYKTMKTFEDKVREQVVTRAEKRYLIKLIKDLKLNEYDKITFCNDYCKFSLR